MKVNGHDHLNSQLGWTWNLGEIDQVVAEEKLFNNIMI